MSINSLMDPTEPTLDQANAALGQTAPFLQQLLQQCGSWEHEWKFHGKKYGWKLKVHDGSKNLLEITVAEGWFLATVAIRGEELEALRQETPELLEAIEAQDRYGVRIEVRDPASHERVAALTRFVMSQRQ